VEEEALVATDSATIDTAPEVAAVPAADPSILGLPSFVVGAVALSLATVGYVPPAAVGAALPIILGATGLGLLITTIWCANLGQSFVACVFGVFTGFWFSYAALVLGLQHNWFAIPAEDVTKSVALFLISWAVVMFFLTVGSVRLPVIYTVLLGLVVIALVLLVFGTLNGSTGLNKLAGYAVFGASALGLYLFLNSCSVALGGAPYQLGRPLRP
jgi:succinate-acetate transporter protein